MTAVFAQWLSQCPTIEEAKKFFHGITWLEEQEPCRDCRQLFARKDLRVSKQHPYPESGPGPGPEYRCWKCWSLPAAMQVTTTTTTQEDWASARVPEAPTAGAPVALRTDGELRDSVSGRILGWVEGYHPMTHTGDQICLFDQNSLYESTPGTIPTSMQVIPHLFLDKQRLWIKSTDQLVELATQRLGPRILSVPEPRPQAARSSSAPSAPSSSSARSTSRTSLNPRPEPSLPRLGRSKRKAPMSLLELEVAQLREGFDDGMDLMTLIDADGEVRVGLKKARLSTRPTSTFSSCLSPDAEAVRMMDPCLLRV